MKTKKGGSGLGRDKAGYESGSSNTFNGWSLG